MEQIRLARPASSLVKPIAYWVTTGLIVLETAVGAEWDLVRIPFVREIFGNLGYPLYLLTILGIWKIPGALVLVIPRAGRLKEWAYAGLFFVYTGASASHFMHGDIANGWSPLVFALLTVASRALRPESRKWEPVVLQGKGKPSIRVVYWITTILIAFSILSGGVFQLIGARESVEGIMRLGYPAFFVRILGFWKLFGGAAIVIPRFPRLKEWAYAGIVFDLTGAAASNAASGMPAWHVIAPLVLTAIALVSWYTQRVRTWSH